MWSNGDEKYERSSESCTRFSHLGKLSEQQLSVSRNPVMYVRSSDKTFFIVLISSAFQVYTISIRIRMISVTYYYVVSLCILFIGYGDVGGS